MAGAPNQPTEVNEVVDQHQRHERGDGQQQHVNDVAARRGIGGQVCHAPNGAADA